MCTRGIAARPRIRHENSSSFRRPLRQPQRKALRREAHCRAGARAAGSGAGPGSCEPSPCRRHLHRLLRDVAVKVIDCAASIRLARSFAPRSAFVIRSRVRSSTRAKSRVVRCASARNASSSTVVGFSTKATLRRKPTRSRRSAGHVGLKASSGLAQEADECTVARRSATQVATNPHSPPSFHVNGPPVSSPRVQLQGGREDGKEEPLRGLVIAGKVSCLRIVS